MYVQFICGIRLLSKWIKPFFVGLIIQLLASIRFLGYCPQENVLWPSLTTREHLEVFAAVKGLRRADARVAISRYCAPMRLLCAVADKEWGVGGHLHLPGAAGVEWGWRPGAKPCTPGWGTFKS